jgi:hypothetical protein
MSRAAVKPSDVLVECARAGVVIKLGNAPGRVRMVGPSEAVQRLKPLVARHKAELLEVLTGRQAAPAPEPAPDPRLSWSDCLPATAAEVVRMLERTEAFERMGLAPDEVDLAADRLLRRDREGWRCASLRQSLPRDLVIRLQRCPSFLGVDPCN